MIVSFVVIRVLRPMAALHPRQFSPDDHTTRLTLEFLESQLSTRTRDSYCCDLAQYFRWLQENDKTPLNARRPDIDRYRNFLIEPVDEHGRPSQSGVQRYANSGAARRISTVRSFYAYLVDRKEIDGSPAVGVKTPRVSRDPQGKALTVEQMRRLLASARDHGPNAEAIVALLCLNGLRVSEVCAAMVQDLRREPGGGRSILVHGKGSKEVWVALNKTTEEAVLRAVGDRTSGPIVRRPADQRRKPAAVAPLRPHTRQSVWRLIRQLGQDAGLADEMDRLHPHLARHGFIQALLDAGVGLAAVQDAARHSSSDTTRRYDRARDAYKEHPTHLLDLSSSNINA